MRVIGIDDLGDDSPTPSVTHLAVDASGTRLATGSDLGITIWSNVNASKYCGQFCGSKDVSQPPSRNMGADTRAWFTTKVPREYRCSRRGNWPSLVRAETKPAGCLIQVPWCTVSRFNDLFVILLVNINFF